MNLTAEQPMVARFSLTTAEPTRASAEPLAMVALDVVGVPGQNYVRSASSFFSRSVVAS
jgi:hypothetical protein